jgi:hypothetical protein
VVISTEIFMMVCLVWFSLMTREGEIGMKSSAPGDSGGPGTFFTSCILEPAAQFGRTCKISDEVHAKLDADSWHDHRIRQRLVSGARWRDLPCFKGNNGRHQ